MPEDNEGVISEVANFDVKITAVEDTAISFDEEVESISKEAKALLSGDKKFGKLPTLDDPSTCRMTFQIISLVSSRCSSVISRMRVFEIELTKLERIAKAMIFEKYEWKDIRNEDTRQAKLHSHFPELFTRLLTLRSYLEAVNELQTYLDFKYNVTSRAVALLDIEAQLET